MIILLIAILFIIILNILIPNHIFRKKIDQEIIESNSIQKTSRLNCYDSKMFFTDNTQIKIDIYKLVDPETNKDIECNSYDSTKEYLRSKCTSRNYINLEDSCTGFLLYLLLQRTIE